MKTLARLRPTRGLSADVPYWEVSSEFYNRMENVLIRSGFASRRGGELAVYDDPISVAPHHLQNYRDSSSNNYWLYFGVSTIYGVNGATHTDLTPGGGLSSITKPSQWNTTLLNGIPIANNGLDAPMYWDGNTANNYAALTDWPANTLAALVVAFKYHLFAFDITVSGSRTSDYYAWSDAAAPGSIPSSWTAAASNEAGDDTLADAPGAIIAARPLKDSLLVYKENSMYALDYVGGNAKFANRKVWSRAGALSPRAVDDINGKHLVVTDGDIVLADGYGEPRSIANSRVRSFLFNQISDETYEALQVMYDQSRQECWIAFPESGEDYCTLALVYNVLLDAWGVAELTDVAHMAMGTVDDTAVDDSWENDTNSWESDVSSWNQASLAAATESLVTAQPNTTELVQFDTNDSTSRSAIIAKYSMPLDEPERVKFVRAVHLRGSGFGTLYVRIGSQMDPEGATTWSDEYTLDSPNQPVYCFASGRYISIEIRSADSSVWTITGFDMEVEYRGFY